MNIIELIIEFLEQIFKFLQDLFEDIFGGGAN